MTTELGRDGDGFTASVKEFVYDCQKFTIELLKGELLKISGDFANAKLNVYSSTGKLMGGRTDTGRAEFIFEAPRVRQILPDLLSERLFGQTIQIRIRNFTGNGIGSVRVIDCLLGEARPPQL